MKVATVILLIVATAIINTECFRILDKRQCGNSLDDGQSCISRIFSCAPSLIIYPFLLGHNSNFGTLAPDIDQICQDAPTALECLQPYVEACPPLLQRNLNSTSQQLLFFCSDEGRSLLRDFQQSVCYANFPDESSFWDACADEGHLAGSVVHSRAFYRRLYNCVGRQFTAACGEAGGRIFSALSEILLSVHINSGVQ
ncbi:hypothetical protein BsWGS_23320 [Bradybaena similaris]